MRARGAVALLLVVGAAGLAWAAANAEVPPRRLAAWLVQRAQGQHSLLGDAVRGLAQGIEALDRGDAPLPLRPPWRPGSSAATAASAAGRPVLVADEAQFTAALQQAEPGDQITLVPGRYRFSGKNLVVARPGSEGAPITVRGAVPGKVLLEFDLDEGLLVSAPYWRFEGLVVRGVCAEPARCEHAFHIVGKADHFVARHNSLSDFNAHFKINGEGADFPDQGLIEGNTLDNAAPRRTAGPVTPVDLVGASGWVLRGNLIADFVREGDGPPSYGAFAKGAGAGNRFERNIVLCEHRLRGQPGSRIGLSLGGGGTLASACRDRRCVTEQDQGVIEANLIAFCSDSGIDINRAARSTVRHNTLLDTGGVSLREPAASAEVEGNLVDGALYRRLDSTLHARDNLTTAPLRLYLGSHPLRARFTDITALDFTWRGEVPRRAAGSALDLCGSPRPAQPAYGAFEDFRACLAKAP